MQSPGCQELKTNKAEKETNNKTCVQSHFTSWLFLIKTWITFKIVKQTHFTSLTLYFTFIYIYKHVVDQSNLWNSCFYLLFIYAILVTVIMLSKQANRVFSNSILTSSQRNHHWVLDHHVIFRKRRKWRHHKYTF